MYESEVSLGKLQKLCSTYVIVLLCEFVGLFLIMSSCESMTDLQWALLVRQKNNALGK